MITILLGLMSEKLTFGELKIGDKFIVFPISGDDAGHGGFKGGHNLFMKVKILKKIEALRISDGNTSKFDKSMCVIKVT